MNHKYVFLIKLINNHENESLTKNRSKTKKSRTRFKNIFMLNFTNYYIIDNIIYFFNEYVSKNLGLEHLF